MQKQNLKKKNWKNKVIARCRLVEKKKHMYHTVYKYTTLEKWTTALAINVFFFLFFLLFIYLLFATFERMNKHLQLHESLQFFSKLIAMGSAIYVCDFCPLSFHTRIQRRVNKQFMCTFFRVVI